MTELSLFRMNERMGEASSFFAPRKTPSCVKRLFHRAGRYFSRSEKRRCFATSFFHTPPECRGNRSCQLRSTRNLHPSFRSVHNPTAGPVRNTAHYEERDDSTINASCLLME